LISAGEIPEVPIYIDSPLTVKASTIFREHKECFDEETWEILHRGEDPFGFDRMHYIKDVEESKQLNMREGPCVIISASGMAEAGRILHHLRNAVSDSKNTILIVGFMAGHTLGKRLESGALSVKIFGREHEVRAEVQSLHAFSAHADRDDLLNFVRTMKNPPREIYLVHGEKSQTEALAVSLAKDSSAAIHIPEMGQKFELGG
jgi:metallo-beta-lactamase family protein